MTLFHPLSLAVSGRASRAIGAAILLAGALVTSACFSSETVIHVRPDGTGTIEVTNLANKDALGMAAGMARGAAKEAGGDPSKAPNLDNIGDLFDEAKVREMGASWG